MPLSGNMPYSAKSLEVYLPSETLYRARVDVVEHSIDSRVSPQGVFHWCAESLLHRLQLALFFIQGKIRTISVGMRLLSA